MIAFTLLPFEALTVAGLYDVLRLRQTVFVVEQACVYLDADGLDPAAMHLLGRDPNGALVAYARLFAPGVSYDEASIGRVVTHPSARRTGLGRELMREAIALLRRDHGDVDIRIGAQCYLERFYEELGFVIDGEPYVEDGIPHVEMILRAHTVQATSPSATPPSAPPLPFSA